MTRSDLPLAALAALLLTPAAAQAAGDPCPKVSADVDKPGAVVDFHDGAREGEVPEGGKIRYPGHFFDATDDIVVTASGNTYRIAKGSTFKFSCYGASIKDPYRGPALMLLTGAVKVTTGQKTPGGVITEEGLFDPRTDPTMVFTVSRKLARKHLDIEGKMAWFANYRSQPHGTTKVKAAKSGPIVGVTPYVGKNPGSCRYVHGARLTTKNDSGKGTSSFTK